MHETSPGQVEKHEISIRSDNKSELNGAKTTTNVDMNELPVKSENIDDEEAGQRIYDDPCELLDEAPIFRMARSRSWFCCPSSDVTTQSNNLFYNRCPEYPLVTEAPRLQFHAVGCQKVARKHRTRFSSISFSARRPPFGLNWICDVIGVFSFFYFQIQALNNDMIELRARLQQSDLEKEELKMQIRELFDDKDSTQRHLEAISQAHESRITEMHCVIVELNKKLKVQQDTAIIEETEPEGSGELSGHSLSSRFAILSSFKFQS